MKELMFYREMGELKEGLGDGLFTIFYHDATETIIIAPITTLVQCETIDLTMGGWMQYVKEFIAKHPIYEIYYLDDEFKEALEDSYLAY